jgi:hypothetical protein
LTLFFFGPLVGWRFIIFPLVFVFGGRPPKKRHTEDRGGYHAAAGKKRDSVTHNNATA